MGKMDDVRESIFGMGSYAELKQAQNAIHIRWNELTRREVSKFKIGDKVSWEHRGNSHTGVVGGVNEKTLTVREDGTNLGSWRIGASSLKLVVDK